MVYALISILLVISCGKAKEDAKGPDRNLGTTQRQEAQQLDNNKPSGSIQNSNQNSDQKVNEDEGFNLKANDSQFVFTWEQINGYKEKLEKMIGEQAALARPYSYMVSGLEYAAPISQSDLEKIVSGIDKIEDKQEQITLLTLLLQALIVNEKEKVVDDVVLGKIRYLITKGACFAYDAKYERDYSYYTEKILIDFCEILISNGCDEKTTGKVISLVLAQNYCFFPDILDKLISQKAAHPISTKMFEAIINKIDPEILFHLDANSNRRVIMQSLLSTKNENFIDILKDKLVDWLKKIDFKVDQYSIVYNAFGNFDSYDPFKSSLDNFKLMLLNANKLDIDLSFQGLNIICFPRNVAIDIDPISYFMIYCINAEISADDFTYADFTDITKYIPQDNKVAKLQEIKNKVMERNIEGAKDKALYQSGYSDEEFGIAPVTDKHQILSDLRNTTSNNSNDLNDDSIVIKYIDQAIAEVGN